MLTISITHGREIKKNEIGKIVLFSGKYEKTFQKSGKISYNKNKLLLFPGERIKTGKNSRVIVMLKKGTGIEILSNTSIDFNSHRTEKTEPPGKIKIHYGKVKFYLKRNFNDSSYIITTQTALIKAVYGKLYIIASEYDSMVYVKYNKIGVTNINPMIKRAYILKENEEIRISKNRIPQNLIFVLKKYRQSWIFRYIIVKQHRFVIKSNRDDEFIDWLIRKRDF